MANRDGSKAGMTIENLRDFFMWGSIINLGLILYYFLIMLFARNFAIGLLQKVGKLSKDQANTIIYMALAFQKILWLVFFVAPYIALSIMK